MSRRRPGRHPKVDLLGGIFRGGLWHEGATGSETGAVLGDQAEFSCPGDSLGAVGCAELAEDVADVLLTVSRVITSSPAMAWFGVPAASIPSTSSSRPVSGSIRPCTRRGGAAPGARHGAFAVECLQGAGPGS